MDLGVHERPLALVTGASRGIGREIARELAARGYDLVVVARSRAELCSLERELAQRHRTGVRVVVSDLALPGAAEELCRLLAADLARIEVLVNNAGIGYYGAFQDGDPLRYRVMLELNAATPTRLTQLLLGHMLARGRGRILMVASTAGLKTGPWNAVYAASKAYLVSLSEALASELAGTGVTVTALCPGATDTGFSAAASLAAGQRLRWKGPSTAAHVARCGIDAMLRGTPLAIPGVLNQLLALFVRVVPRGVTSKIMNRVRAAAV